MVKVFVKRYLQGFNERLVCLLVDMEFFEHPLIISKKLEYREYQEKIASIAVKRNTLVVLPTGTGKTVIALLTILKWLDAHPDARIFFLAPTKPLVHQHYSFFKNVLKDTTNLVFLTGEKRPEGRKLLWNQKFIFCTPQLLYNDLVKGYVKITDKDIIVFDEAHRAVGNYAYVRIATYLKMKGVKPRILALTASPGDVEKTREIIRNLGLEDIEVYTKEDPLISKYFHGYRIETRFIDKTPVLSHIISLIEETIARYVERANQILSGYNVKLDKRRLSYTNIEEIREKLTELTDNILDKEEEKKIREAKKILYKIILLDKLHTYVETYTYLQGYKFLQQILGIGGSTPKRGLTLKQERNLWEVYQLLRRLVEKKELHPKTKALLEVVENYRFKRCLVFASLKDTAYELKDVLEQRGFPTSVLVGRGSSGTKGMKQKMQIRTLEEFSRGSLKILIATHVGEEGLDISEVDLVVFYDNPISVIRRIQRMGRTGRKEKGLVVYLILKGSRDQIKYFAGIRRYKNLIDGLRELKKEIRISNQPTIFTFLNERETVKNDKKETEDRPVVYVDAREKGNIVTLLEKRGVKLTIENLDIGDYIIGNTIIERKTIKDFSQSLYQGRLFQQLKELSEVKNMEKIMVLEGNKKDLLLSMGPKVAIGTLLSIIRDFKIPVYFSINEEETAALIETMYRKLVERGQKTERIRLDKKPKRIEDIQLYVLSGIPGIDAKTAKKLLKAFGSLRAIANASVNDLMKVYGIGPELATRIYRVFNHRFSSED